MPRLQEAQFSDIGWETEKWTSGLIVVILLLLIMPTVLSMLGWKVSLRVAEKTKDAAADTLQIMRKRDYVGQQ
jgi:hypothetical protein